MLLHRISLTLCLALSIASSCYSANNNDDGSNYNVNGVIHIYGNEVSFPMTSWQEKAMNKHLEQKQKKHPQAFKTFSNEKDGVFIFEQIPNEESFDSWSKLYSILGMDHPKETPINLYAVTNANHQLFKDSCVDYRYEEESANASPHDSTIITIFCERIKGTPEGEIMIKYIAVTNNNQSIEVYHEWKGSPFDRDEPSTWPVDQAEIADVKQRFNAISILGPKQIEPE